MNLQIADLEAKLIENEADHKARLDLARLYFELGMLDEAQRHFEIVLASKPPKQVEKNILRFLSLIEARKQRGHTMLFAQVGYGQDSNVNANPGEDKLLDFMVREYNLDRDGTQVSDELSDSFSQVMLGVDYGYDFGRKGFWSVIANAFGYSQRYAHESDFDLGLLQGSVGMRYQNGPWDVSLPLSYGSLTYGGEAFMTLTGLSPVAAYRFSRDMNLYVKASRTQKRYAQSDYEARDATQDSTGAGVQYIVGRYMIGAGIAQEREAAEKSGSSFVDRTAQEGKVDLGVKLPAAVTLGAGYLYRTNAYDDKLSSGKTREDGFSQASVSGSLEAAKNLTLTLRYTAMRNVSDYTPAEYTKNIGLLTLSYRY